jgi:hypothetical protein
VLSWVLPDKAQNLDKKYGGLFARFKELHKFSSVASGTAVVKVSGVNTRFDTRPTPDSVNNADLHNERTP